MTCSRGDKCLAPMCRGHARWSAKSRDPKNLEAFKRDVIAYAKLFGVHWRTAQTRLFRTVMKREGPCPLS